MNSVNKGVEGFLFLLNSHINLVHPKTLIFYEDSYISLSTVLNWDIEEKKDFLMKFFIRYSDSNQKPIFCDIHVKKADEVTRINLKILLSKSDLKIYQKLYDYFHFCEI